jgi:hypothetical protein
VLDSSHESEFDCVTSPCSQWRSMLEAGCFRVELTGTSAHTGMVIARVKITPIIHRNKIYPHSFYLTDRFPFKGLHHAQWSFRLS